MYEIYDKKGKKIEYYYDNDGVLKHIQYDKVNTIINISNNGDIEIIKYNEDFLIPKVNEVNYLNLNLDNYTLKEVTRERNFIRDIDGALKANKVTTRIKDLQKTIKKGGKRARHNFYSFALNYKWDYFCTFTFKDKEDRFDREKIKLLWKMFNNKLRAINPDYRLIAVMEPHEGWTNERELKERKKLLKDNTPDEIESIIKYKKENAGGYHLHALLANVDLSLSPARDPKTGEFKYTCFGNQIFNCNLWDKGFSTIAILPPDTNSRKIANYCAKYIAKDLEFFYGEKRYYKTRNLKARETTYGNFTDYEVQLLSKEYGTNYIRKNNEVTYYTKS